MKVKMLQSVNGKVNGIRMGPYTEGKEYDLDQDRALLFIGSAMAEEITAIGIDVEISKLEPETKRRRK